MRAFSWVALGVVVVACGGSAFTTNDGPGGGGTNGAGAAAGSPDPGGSAAGTSSAGMGAAGDLGAGGDTTTTGGTSAVAGSSTGGTETAGTSMGGTDTAGGGVGGTSAGTSGAGTGGTPPLDTTCPRTQPSKGAACTGSLKCTYGSDVRTSCRNTAQCTDGAWVVTRPNCDSLNSCNNIQVGAACEQGDKPCLLDSNQGIYCVCTGCGAGPCTDKPTWACAAGLGGNTCPIVAPNLGSTCVGDKICGYGSCATGNAINAVCDGSTWAWHNVACAL